MVETCVICGNEMATTRDHIPPKGIFLKPRPGNLITVPACSKCNNGDSTLDEKFLAHLGAHVSYSGGEGEKFFTEKVLRTLNHNRRLRHEINSKIKPVNVKNAEGVTIRKEFVGEWDKEAHIRVVERTIRGLYYHHFNEILGSTAAVKTHFFSSLPRELQECSKDWAYNSFGNDIVIYKYTSAVKDGVRTSIWLFQFYGAHWAGGQTMSK